MDREPSFGGDLAGEFGGSALGVDIYGCGEPFDQATPRLEVDCYRHCWFCRYGVNAVEFLSVISIPR